MCCQDPVHFLYDLPNGTILAKKIVVSLVLSIIEIIVIENHKLDGTFLHVTFRSQIMLRITSDLTNSELDN
jgi:hypothetical protein